jgi:aspartate/methionine/tyrosine aminotransferase
MGCFLLGFIDTRTPVEGTILVTQLDLDSPQFVVPPEHRIPVHNYPADMAAIPPSRMFVIRETLNAYREKMGADAQTYNASQGDGGASLPGVPPTVLEGAFALQMERGTAYTPPAGMPRFRTAAAENYWQLDSETGWGPGNILFVQGGRDGLQKAYNAMVNVGTGETGSALVVSRVPWVSYAWGPYPFGLNVMLAPGRPEDGWRYTPESIKACADLAASEGRKIAGIIITSPDNPTGRTLSAEEQIALAKAALENGIAYVIFDWIYHWVTDDKPSDINVVLKAFSPEERERLIFLDGLTKSLGASNIRSAHLVGGKKLIDYISSNVTHGMIPSYFSQAVAISAFEMGFAQASKPIIEPIRASRQIMREELPKQGIPHVLGDGYYAFLDCARYLDAAGMSDSEELLKYMGENYGIVFVPGSHFSEAGAKWMRFSYALPPDVTKGALERLFEGFNSLL